MSPAPRAPGKSTPGPRLTIKVDPARDHVQGAADAPVTLVEYGDYQCPYCGAAYPIVKEVQRTIGPRLRFVFRNFPLTEAHPFAEVAAEVAEAASDLGKFWEMHDALYENQAQLADPGWFFRLAGERWGLDQKVLESQVRAHEHLDRIRNDFMGGVHSGVNGTPTFYINGVRHDGTYERSVLLAAVEAAEPPKGRKR